MSLKYDPTYSAEPMYGTEKAPKPPRRNSPKEVLVFLLVAGIVLIILLVPSVNAFFRTTFSWPSRPALDPSTRVWTNKKAGVYYCPGHRFYGRGAGKYLKQGEALSEGYQPALGHYCSPPRRSGTGGHAASVNHISRGRRTSASGRSRSIVRGSL